MYCLSWIACFLSVRCVNIRVRSKGVWLVCIRRIVASQRPQWDTAAFPGLSVSSAAQLCPHAFVDFEKRSHSFPAQYGGDKRGERGDSQSFSPVKTTHTHRHTEPCPLPHLDEGKVTELMFTHEASVCPWLLWAKGQVELSARHLDLSVKQSLPLYRSGFLERKKPFVWQRQELNGDSRKVSNGL